MTDRKLLSKLSLSAWKVLSKYLKTSVSYDDATPGAVVAIHTFGEFQNQNPHLHIIATDGCFNDAGYFMVGTRPNAKDLEHAFRQEIFKFLKKEGKINDADSIIPQLIDSGISNKERRRSWARLIQKIYNVDPLICPKCAGEMKIVAFIEENWLIRKILMHLNLWDTRNHDPPENKSSHISELVYDNSYSQIPEFDYYTQ